VSKDGSEMTRPPPTSMAAEARGNGRPQVVIVGAGFGGLACARKLDRQPLEVLLIDRRNYHLFTPLLYQVATSLLNPSDIAYPLRAVFRRSPNIRFRQAEVRSVDWERRAVVITSGERFPYDYLVLATGSNDEYFGNEQVARAAISFKGLEGAQRLRNHVLACLERASAASERSERERLLTFVVVGGGPTGVEYAGALAELLHLVMGRDYPGLSRDEARILLVEGRERLLGAFPEQLGAYAERVLQRRGVEIRTGTLVTSADERSATLSDGTTIPTTTIVWSAGVGPGDPLGNTVPRSRSRRIEVGPDLGIRGRPGSFAIGDVASVLWRGSELPMLSPPAMQAGRYVARVILCSARGLSPPPPFRYVDKGTMATIGRNAAVASIAGLHLTGFVAWVTWAFVHIYYLIGFRNRLAALMSWAWNYLRWDHPIRIIVQADPDPMVGSLGAGSPGPRS
jgi:NADH dehydrogenase